MAKEVFKEIIRNFHRKDIPFFYQRKLELPVGSRKIISVIGSRRSGKTYLLYQTMRSIQNRGVPIEKLIYINFEDERLNGSSAELDQVLQAYRELYPGHPIDDCYIFLDEVQNMQGWERFVRRVYDTETQHVFITGSNSKLLSREIATELRGRSIAYEVFPLNFSEYLEFNKLKPDLYHAPTKSKIINAFSKFMRTGGFPETVKFDNELRFKTLNEYFNTMLFRDIIERHRIKDVRLLKFYLKKLFASVGKPISVNRIFNELKSMGFEVSKNSLYEFLEYFKDTFMILSIDKFDHSEIKQLKSNKKAYPIDHGFLPVIDQSLSKNLGKAFENLVALEFIKSEKNLYYFKQHHECDFIVKSGGEVEAIQVSYSVGDPATLNREIKGLSEACNYLKLGKGTIITFDESFDTKYNNIKIEVVEGWKYFLKHQ
ncbi:MAG: hypothetical protein B6D64_07225 [Bacteroidetes bacterium 4484_276]|nr:MAG: hypothetical protein B6D64_07225 [Bacteroidetes bacterium 4484_276]